MSAHDGCRIVSIAIRTLDAAEAEARLGELADILVDAVAHGASVNFMAGFSHARGRCSSGATSCPASPRTRSGCSSATMGGGWWRRPC